MITKREDYLGSMGFFGGVIFGFVIALIGGLAAGTYGNSIAAIVFYGGIAICFVCFIYAYLQFKKQPKPEVS
jgi:hypothetical protein